MLHPCLEAFENMGSLALVIVGASDCKSLHSAGHMRQDTGTGRGVTVSLFPFLDWLEEAEGEQLEQGGRCCPAARGLFSWPWV